MARNSSKRRVLALFLFLLAGVIVGTFIGNILAYLTKWELFTFSFSIGTSGTPAWLDLSVLRLCIGIAFKINFGTVLGIVAGLILYFKT